MVIHLSINVYSDLFSLLLLLRHPNSLSVSCGQPGRNDTEVEALTST